MFIVAKIIAAFFVALVVALYVGPHLIAAAYKLNFTDVPQGSLKKHKEPVAYLGGLVVYLGFIVALILFYPFETNSIFFLLGSTLLLIIGLIDDCVSLRPLEKFIGQALAVVCFARGGLFLKGIFFSAQTDPIRAYAVWVPLSCFWMLSIINAFNLIDVMDGLATTTALMAAAGFLLIAISMAHVYPVALLLAAFMGALFGFLWFNKQPARMYLGDAGALFIGGILATVPFMIPWGQFSWYGYIAPVILLAIPALELGTLIIIRVYKGIPFYCGSPHHFSHFLKSLGWSTANILRYVIAYSCALIFLTVCFLKGVLSPILLVIGVIFLGILWYKVILDIKIGP